MRKLLLLVALLFLALPVHSVGSQTNEQKVFASPEEARDAVVSAVQARDRSALIPLFGPALHDLETGDPVEDALEFDHFSRHVLEGVDLVKQGDDKAILQVGTKKYPFPIPLARKDGAWFFDTRSGREEILTRRIGHNELLAINACRSYVEAQREYYNMQPVPDGVPIPKYAQHLISSLGKKDGLYWPTVAGEKESPLGPLVAKARGEGYLSSSRSGEGGPHPFHGYYFRILNKQGKAAPGGKYNYVINGNMVGGHAVVAYPAKWGVSGIMTFIVNQSGRVYQKNLGPKTVQIARKMKRYNPDQSWKLVAP